MNFQKHAQHGEAFVNEIARALNSPDDTARASRVMRSTLHVLRDQSTPEECLQLIAQLPMAIKAVFVDGWKIGAQGKRVRRLEDFAARVVEINRASGSDDILDYDQGLESIGAVFEVIKSHVSEGEIEDLRRTLPEGLQPLLTAS